MKDALEVAEWFVQKGRTTKDDADLKAFAANEIENVLRAELAKQASAHAQEMNAAVMAHREELAALKQTRIDEAAKAAEVAAALRGEKDMLLQEMAALTAVMALPSGQSKAVSANQR